MKKHEKKSILLKVINILKNNLLVSDNINVTNIVNILYNDTMFEYKPTTIYNLIHNNREYIINNIDIPLYFYKNSFNKTENVKENIVSSIDITLDDIETFCDVLPYSDAIEQYRIKKCTGIKLAITNEAYLQLYTYKYMECVNFNILFGNIKYRITTNGLVIYIDKTNEVLITVIIKPAYISVNIKNELIKKQLSILRKQYPYSHCTNIDVILMSYFIFKSNNIDRYNILSYILFITNEMYELLFKNKYFYNSKQLYDMVYHDKVLDVINNQTDLIKGFIDNIKNIENIENEFIIFISSYYKIMIYLRNLFNREFRISAQETYLRNINKIVPIIYDENILYN